MRILSVILCYLTFLLCNANGCMVHSKYFNDNTKFSNISVNLNAERPTSENINSTSQNITAHLHKRSELAENKLEEENKRIVFNFGDIDRVHTTSPAPRLIHFHRIVTPIRVPINENEILCKISEANILLEGKCQRILTQGSCPQGHWIILDRYQIPRCVPRKCPLNEIFYQGRCVNITDDINCNENELIYMEYTGRAFCDCQQGFVYNPTTRKCFREHDRGTCPFSMYQEVNPEGTVACTKNPCTYPNLILNEADNKCYNKDFLGRCDMKNPDLVLIFIASDMTARCESIAERNIFEVPALSCPAGSRRDHLNKCQRVITFNQRYTNLFIIPTQFTSARSTCPVGYLRYPNNTCRKPNSIFST